MNTERLPCQWGGIGIELGQLQRKVESIADVQALFRSHKLPMNAALLNYQYFHQSTLDATSSILRVIEKSLQASGIAAQQVELLIITSAELGFLANDSQFMPALLEQAGLTQAVPMAVTAQECTGLLSAIEMAWRYVQNGRFQNALVVSYDEPRTDERRVQPFGIVSDAAVACMVSAEKPLGFTLRGFSVRADVAGMRGKGDFDNRKALINKVNADLVAESGITVADINKVFSTNFFRPLTNFNAASMGLTAPQLYLEQVPIIGHCLAADALLNLSAYLREHSASGLGQRYLLQAFAPGLLAGMLIEQVAEITPHVSTALLEEALEEQTW